MGGWCISYATDLWSFHWVIQIILNGFSTDFFYVKIFALGRGVSLFIYFFCHAKAKLAQKQWSIVVTENIANFRFRSSTVESCVCLLSRLVPVLNDTYGLAWIIHQLLHVTLYVYSRSLNLAIFLLSFRFSIPLSANTNNFQNSTTSNESWKSYIFVVRITHDMNLNVNIKPHIQANT